MHMSQMLERKSLKPIIGQIFAFADILEAYRVFEEERPKGKIVITM